MTDRKFNAEDSLAILKSKDGSGVPMIKGLASFSLLLDADCPKLVPLYFNELSTVWVHWVGSTANLLPKDTRDQLADQNDMLKIVLNETTNDLRKEGVID